MAVHPPIISEDVTAPLPSRTSQILQPVLTLLVLIAGLGMTGIAAAQNSAGDAEPGSGHILLVLPFDNLTGATASTPSGSPASSSPASEQTNLDWLREAAPEVLNSRFTSRSEERRVGKEC